MPSRHLRRWARRSRRRRSGGVSHERHDAADVGFVAGVDGALGAALVERAQDPASDALDEEPDDDFPAAPGVAHRDQAPSAASWSGPTQTVVAHGARGAMASSATRTMNVSRSQRVRQWEVLASREGGLARRPHGRAVHLFPHRSVHGGAQPRAGTVRDRTRTGGPRPLGNIRGFIVPI